MSDDAWTLAIWSLIGLGVLGLVVASLLPGTRIPTLAATVRPFTDRRFCRIALIAGWMWLGWHVFAR